MLLFGEVVRVVLKTHGRYGRLCEAVLKQEARNKHALGELSLLI